MMAAPDHKVPEGLLEKADAVAAFPRRWGTPAFLEIAGSSAGLQLRGEAIDFILVFTEPDAIEEMLKDNLKLRADAGPVGRHVGVGTSMTFDAPVCYARNQGVFAGVSLDGSAIQINDSANRDVDVDEVNGADILIRGAVDEREITKPFTDALKRHAGTEP